MFKYAAISGTFGRFGYDVLEAPEAALEAIRAAGYDGVDLPGDPQRIDVDALRKLIDSSGLEVNEVQAAWAFHHAGEDRDLAAGDEAGRRRGIEYGKQCVDLAADLGGRYVEICAPQTPVPQIPYPRMPLHTLRSNFLASAREITEYAAERDIGIVFEPLNRYESYPGVLTTVYDAINLINDLGLPNLGVQPDIYHMNVAEASITDALRAAGSHIRVMHMRETNDYFLGEGHADYHAIVKILKELDFQGYLSIYMPLTPPELSYRDPSVLKPDLLPVLERQLSFLKGIERAVDRQRSIYDVEAPYVVSGREQEDEGKTEVY